MTSTPFFLLCGVGLFAIFSSTISKSPVLPLFVSFLGGGPAAVGAIAAVSAATGILVSFPAGLLSDRIGRRRMLLFSGLVFATAPLLYLGAREVWQLALARLYHGLATAVFVPVAMAFVADLHREGRGEKMGWFSTATLAGRFAAPALGGGILGLAAGEAGLGFKEVYLVCAATGLLAFLGMLRLPRPAAPAATAAGTAKSWRRDAASLLGNRGILITCAVEAAILFAYGTFETFLPLRGVSAGLSPFQIGLCLSSQVLTVAFSKPVMGRLSDRHGRPPQIVTGALFGGLCAALLALPASFPLFLVLSVLLGLAISVVTAATAAHIADLSGDGKHGSAMGLLGSLMDIGHSTGPLIGGLLAAAFGTGASFLGAGLVLTVSAILFLRIGRNPSQFSA